MLWFLNTHPEQFTNRSQPFMIASMQTFGGFLAEITNLFMLSTRTTVEYCIMYFVAFHVLTAIDNIYAEGVCDFALLHAVE
jgi:succinate dehydrogenase/fumarate reductase cytochrome b subunit